MAGSKQTHLCFILFTFFLLCWDPTPIHANAKASAGGEHLREFEFNLGSEKRPERWGDLKKEWKTCKTGKLQSPIDLRDEVCRKVNASLDHFQISYRPTKAILKNEGHAFAVVWEGDAGGVKINGTEYNLRQCHWHTPSEHTINGKRYEVELHMVHKAKNNNDVAVVGFLYKLGKPNPFLSKVKKAIANMKRTVKEVDLGVIDPRKMKKAQIKFHSAQMRKNKKANSKFYRYMGSFTTPPCTEGVTWTINKQVHTVSKGQVRLLQKAVFDYAMLNVRPLQPLNGRELKIHGSSFSPLKQ